MIFNSKIILLLVLPFVIMGTYGYPHATSSSPGSLEIPSFTFQYNRIVGGKPAKKSQFPYQLSLRRYGRHICGASLIKVNGVLLAVTAAHCVDEGISYPEAVYSVIAGDLKFSDTTGSEQRRLVTKIVVHEKYEGSSRGIFNDIALLFLKGRPFELNDDVRNIKLPEENEETFGNLTISGWGRTQSGGGLPDILQYIEMPVLNQTVCQDRWANVEIGDGILCSGDENGKMAPCNGDSGGPAKSNNGGYLAGIVSFGPRGSCAHTYYPAGFTKVSYYIEWIYRQVDQFNKSA